MGLEERERGRREVKEKEGRRERRGKKAREKNGSTDVAPFQTDEGFEREPAQPVSEGRGDIHSHPGTSSTA